MNLALKVGVVCGPHSARVDLFRVLLCRRPSVALWTVSWKENRVLLFCTHWHPKKPVDAAMTFFLLYQSDEAHSVTLRLSADMIWCCFLTAVIKRTQLGSQLQFALTAPSLSSLFFTAVNVELSRLKAAFSVSYAALDPSWVSINAVQRICVPLYPHTWPTCSLDCRDSALQTCFFSCRGPAVSSAPEGKLQSMPGIFIPHD